MTPGVAFMIDINISGVNNGINVVFIILLAVVKLKKNLSSATPTDIDDILIFHQSETNRFVICEKNFTTPALAQFELCQQWEEIS
jgi:hypothetical protein